MKILKLFIFTAAVVVAGCNGLSNKKTPLYKIPEVSKNILTPALQNQFYRGIDFTASGDKIADWQLEMNFDDSIRFQAQNGLSFTIPAVRPVMNSDSSQSFISSISLGKVVINISNENCLKVQSSNSVINRLCTVSIGNITYSGCGQYLYDSELDNKWELQQYKADKISAAIFKNGLPYLKFDILNNKFIGFDGCNNISGAAEVQGKRIKFSSLTSTKKVCAGNLLQNPYAVLTNQLVGYKILNDLLYLYLIDDSVLIFKKTT